MVRVAVSRPARPEGVRVKICGLTRPEHVAWAAGAGASYLGFVFFPKSSRNVSAETARGLGLGAPAGIAKVALLVDADDAAIGAILERVPLDMLQLHGHETPGRVAEVRARFGLPVMKAVGVAGAADLDALPDYEAVADQILLEHTARSREGFASGAVLAAEWIVGKTGFYEFSDVIDEVLSEPPA